MIEPEARHSVRVVDDALRASVSAHGPGSERVALDALRSAARRLGVDAHEMRVAEYRLMRSRDPRLPSELSIREAFGSWQRARERAVLQARRAGRGRREGSQ